MWMKERKSYWDSHCSSDCGCSLYRQEGSCCQAVFRQDTACLHDPTLKMELTKSASTAFYFWPIESKDITKGMPAFQQGIRSARWKRSWRSGRVFTHLFVPFLEPDNIVTLMFSILSQRYVSSFCIGFCSLATSRTRQNHLFLLLTNTINLTVTAW